ncbi:hypothetical protein LTR62_002710 [Meristemomyces frigidus]|uniref:Peptidase S33 tripeptidyl aminopeptidase-like C-terminal domain-containing protein n=1 Tax=Meristemomyces frigidus TaxID=1508187 RepID=A0AAN7TLJ3_9PEZI|nr:hypothetical protein LTR62_002710 [Meristemomyces frigidus]
MYFDQLSSAVLQSSAWLQNQVPLAPSPPTVTGGGFRWDDITPEKHFAWHACFDDFKCARLQVPMDWQGNSSEANKTVEIAVIKIEATVPVTDPTYGGAVVLNPGGPGGSGIGQVQRGGKHVRTVLSAGPGAEEDTAKHYDIIGFDPRGVSNTRPLLTCFPDRIEAAVYGIEEEAHGYMGSSDKAFDNAWASKRAVADGCSKRAAEEGVAKHMSTAPVARDIVEIFERHGEWREQEAKNLLSEQTTLNTAEKTEVLRRTAWRKNQEKLQYWGFSYGTVLGATLTAMYPDRINRAVLDGVADSHDYMAGGWATNLRDTDMIWTKLADYCWQGGKKNCPVWHEDGPAVIAQNLAVTLQDLQQNPIGVPQTKSSGPALITANDFARLIFAVVYNPLKIFPLLVQVLHDLSTRNGTSLANWAHTQRPAGLNEPLSDQCSNDGPYSPACFERDADPKGGIISWDATYAIACSDASSTRVNDTKAEFATYVDLLTSQSRLIGAAWAGIMLPCTAWHARAHWRYEGDFHARTAEPILFVGNSIDPVTPLYNAFMMAKGYKGAGVLHQNSEGHCTYGSVSLCSGRAIRRYFQSGELPGKIGGLKDEEWAGFGLLCEPDLLPLGGYDGEGPGVPDMPKGEEDEELWKALVGLNRVWP